MEIEYGGAPKGRSKLNLLDSLLPSEMYRCGRILHRIELLGEVSKRAGPYRDRQPQWGG